MHLVKVDEFTVGNLCFGHKDYGHRTLVCTDHHMGAAPVGCRTKLDKLDTTGKLLISGGVQTGHDLDNVLLRNNIGGLCNQRITVM